MFFAEVLCGVTKMLEYVSTFFCLYDFFLLFDTVTAADGFECV